jgi:alkylated DNA nucleotide flippase Atl1
MNTIIVNALFIKEKHDFPMVSVPEMELVPAFGIVGDINANSLSPRQILITRQEDLDMFNIPQGGLRENIILQGCTEDQFRPGNVLNIGDTSIRLTFNCEPCKRISSHVKPSDIIGRRGILGTIIKGGFIFENSSVSIEYSKYAPMSDLPFDRFKIFISQVPTGRIVTYKEIVIGMGVASSYLRAIPTYIGKSDSTLPTHRIVDSEGNLILSYVSNQIEKLKQEGIIPIQTRSLFEDGSWYVPLDKYLWKNGLMA